VLSPDPIRRLADLPADRDDLILDCVAGGLVRIFARLNQLEVAYRDLRARLVVIERSQPAPAPTSSASSAARTTLNGHADRRGSTPASRAALRARAG
jgi:hypothetical protein